MIWLQQPQGEVFNTAEELENCGKSLETFEIKSYEEYLEKGHKWCWCLVGNIVKEHEFGEDKEIKSGTKHFVAGAKVCLASAQWGDGYERIVAIGVARKSRKYIEVVMQEKYVENFRMQKIYKPSIIRRMTNSEYTWWSDSDDDSMEIIQYLEMLGSAEAEKEKQVHNDDIS